MKKWLKVLALCLPLFVVLTGCNQTTPPAENSNVAAPEEVPSVDEVAPATEEAAPATEAPAAGEAAPATEAPAAQ